MPELCDSVTKFAENGDRNGGARLMPQDIAYSACPRPRSRIARSHPGSRTILGFDPLEGLVDASLNSRSLVAQSAQLSEALHPYRLAKAYIATQRFGEVAFGLIEFANPHLTVDLDR
jgi:hypothetical protein